MDLLTLSSRAEDAEKKIEILKKQLTLLSEAVEHQQVKKRVKFAGKALPPSVSKTAGMKVAIQRANSASILVDNDSTWVEMGRGLVVYFAFSEGITDAGVAAAAKAVVNLPLLTMGQWGDGSKNQSIVDLMKTAECWDPLDLSDGGSVGVMVVPQASMVSKFKGKSLKYHSQLDKEKGRALYVKFLSLLQQEACEAQLLSLFGAGKQSGASTKFDKRGVPVTDAQGKPLDKSEKKKNDKIYREAAKELQDLASRREARWSTAVASSEVGTGESLEAGEVLRVVAGTFGNRQGLKLDSFCGPLTHVFEF